MHYSHNNNYLDVLTKINLYTCDLCVFLGQSNVRRSNLLQTMMKGNLTDLDSDL